MFSTISCIDEHNFSPICTKISSLFADIVAADIALVVGISATVPCVLLVSATPDTIFPAALLAIFCISGFVASFVNKAAICYIIYTYKN